MTEAILQHYSNEFRTGRDVAPSDAERLFDSIIAEMDEKQLTGLLSAWNKKGVTEDELFAFAIIMRDRMKRISTHHAKYIDTVGTGGSKAKTFNVSTAAAFVIAGAGTVVAKHGNRAATSNSGSSDVLALLGIEVDIDPEHTERHLNEYGLSFLFAPRFHRLTFALANARRSLGEPTIFNNLGPLCNPASAPHHIIGVAAEDQFERTSKVLARLGTERSWIVRAKNGLDEIALSGTTFVAEIAGSGIKQFEITAADFGIKVRSGEVPSNCNANESETLIRSILGNGLKDENAETLVLINAAAAIYVADSGTGLSEAYDLAKDSVRSGAAAAKLNALAAETVR